MSETIRPKANYPDGNDIMKIIQELKVPQQDIEVPKMNYPDEKVVVPQTPATTRESKKGHEMK